MFAVKGWNVDASQLKAQIKPFKDVQQDADVATAAEKSSRKRKRDRSETTNVEASQSAEPVNDKAGSKKSKKQQAREQRTDTVVTKPSAENETSAQDSISLQQEQSKDKKRKKKHREEQSSTASLDVPQLPATTKLTPMQAAMRQKLISARFRHLNETLYTAPSQQSQELFNSNPEMFEDYHAGFRQQVSVWPENPVDKMIQKIRQRGKIRLPSQKKAFSNGKPSKIEEATDHLTPPLPRTTGTCVIADCGCGDARIAQTLKSANDLQKLNLKIHSFDLSAPSPLITKADISQLPLADGSVDVVIFCLALMGTNWISFIEEAFRVLHWKGELWIAEIKSRFSRPGKKGRVVEHSVGNRQKRAIMQKAQTAKLQEQEEAAHEDALAVEVDGVEKVVQATDVQSFVDVLKRRGFLLQDDQASIDLNNKMFVSMEFAKSAAPNKGKNFKESIAPPTKKTKFIAKPAEDDVNTDDEGKTLKPCLYKIR